MSSPRSRFIPAIIGLVAGVLVTVGTFLPSSVMSTGLETRNINGFTSGGDDFARSLVMLGGGVIILAVWACYLVTGNTRMPTLSLIAGVVTGAMAFYETSYIQDTIDSFGVVPGFDFKWTMGIGLNVVVIGAATAILPGSSGCGAPTQRRPTFSPPRVLRPALTPRRNTSNRCGGRGPDVSHSQAQPSPSPSRP